MVKLRHTTLLAAIAVMFSGMAANAAAPEPAAMLAPQFQPKQAGVNVTTPTGADVAACKVELVNGPGSASGWMLKDARGNPVRKFVASKGSKSAIDVWSYYLDGQECYREISTKGNGKADHFRWYGPGGSRWGVDLNDDGKIDGWMMISAEEVSQELLKAIASRDVNRFRALLINEKEIASLELPPAEADKFKQQIKQAVDKFSTAAAACSSVTDKSVWMHLEVQAPQCVSADNIGGKLDLVHYKSASVLFENGGKHDWITLGEVVQVGRAWRLLSAPSTGNGGAGPEVGNPDVVKIPEEAKKLVDELQSVDKLAVPGAAGAPAASYHLKRAAVLEKIVNAMPAAEREQWVKQLADSYSAASQNLPATDTSATDKLKALFNAMAKESPTGNLTSYAAFRLLSAEYTTQSQTAKPDEFTKVQENYREKLKDFVTKYPQAEDAPDAALNVAMISEFMGKETESKNWYTKVTTDYAKNIVAPKAAGALRRLGLEGQPFELQGQTLTGANFNFGQMKDKVTVVYYWASWNNQCASDMKNLTKLMKEYSDKKVELVTINLDTTAAEANTIVGASKVPGTHLFAPGALDSPHAVQYGIMVLPQIFLVGKDGKCVSRTVQINTLDNEIDKLVK